MARTLRDFVMEFILLGFSIDVLWSHQGVHWDFTWLYGVAIDLAQETFVRVYQSPRALPS